MDLQGYLSNSSSLWSAYNHHDTRTTEVSTVWHVNNHETDGSVIRHETLEGQSFSTWLQTPCPGLSSAAVSLTSRMVWIKRDVKEQSIGVSSKTLNHIITTLDLNDALAMVFTAYAGAQRISPAHRTGDANVLKYGFGIHPKIIMLWSYDVTNNSVQGIYFGSKQQILQFRQLVEVRWREPMLMVPLACATILSLEVDETQRSTKEHIGQVEVRTGYHNWKSRTEAGASGGLGSLSAQMSGLASKLASVNRKTDVIEQILRLTSDMASNPAVPEGDTTCNSDIRLLRQRIDMHRIDTDFLRQRIEIQLAALFNLIAQNDAIASFEVAKQSKIVAVASQRDSKSMKTLAVVTIFFLPGQVVASIFAMPLFNWTAGQSTSDSSSVVNNRFGIYWAVTIPLTFATFCLAAIWLLFEQRRQQDKVDELDAMETTTQVISEIGALTRRRSTARST